MSSPGYPSPSPKEKQQRLPSGGSVGGAVGAAVALTTSGKSYPGNLSTRISRQHCGPAGGPRRGKEGRPRTPGSRTLAPQPPPPGGQPRGGRRKRGCSGETWPPAPRGGDPAELLSSEAQHPSPHPPTPPRGPRPRVPARRRGLISLPANQPTRCPSLGALEGECLIFPVPGLEYIILMKSMAIYFPRRSIPRRN